MKGFDHHQPGQRVGVTGGTFAGYTGAILDPETYRDSDSQRLRDQRGNGVWVLLRIFDQETPVPLHPELISPE